VLEHRPGGARIVSDVDLPPPNLRTIWQRLRRRRRRRMEPMPQPTERPALEARDRAPLH
jgi:hypothetical protein